MVIIIKKILLFFCIFFLFNTLEVDSNSNKNLFYDRNNIYEENHYTVYFNNANSIELEEVLNNLNIRVLSYIIDDKKYYARNIDELVRLYSKDKSLYEKVYYENNGINIDGINIVSQNIELIKLEKIISVY